MSDPGRSPSPNPWSTASSVAMILLGVGLLLPGVCAGAYMVAISRTPSGLQNSGLADFWGICFAISGGGIALIWRAIRRLRS
jgi:hypothetical protein